VYKTQDFNLFFSILRKRKRKRTTEKVTETKQQEERGREQKRDWESCGVWFRKKTTEAS
jgi:hypothetical protein